MLSEIEGKEAKRGRTKKKRYPRHRKYRYVNYGFGVLGTLYFFHPINSNITLQAYVGMWIK
jgi:hypothetical protein